MKISIYQFMGLSGPYKRNSKDLKKNKLYITGSLYASTRDFPAFEACRDEETFSIDVSVVINLDSNNGKIITATNPDDSDQPVTTTILWKKNNKTYIGMLYHDYPIILELTSGFKWFRLFYTPDIFHLNNLVSRFKDAYDYQLKHSITLAKTRLNVNIALEDVEIPGLCPEIY